MLVIKIIANKSVILSVEIYQRVWRFAAQFDVFRRQPECGSDRRTCHVRH